MRYFRGIFRTITLSFLVFCTSDVNCGENDYNIIHNDGSYEFGGDSPDSYHYADANRNNIVRGEFGARNSKTGDIDRTIYTAGPRGFRPRGKNIVRNYDLSQSGPRPNGSPDDPYYDPYEDPSYQFGFRTRTHTRQENANRAGDVTGRYSYVDDVGERHNVEYIAGKRTGFHVKTPFPDSNTNAYGPLYFRGRGRPIPRGRTSIQRGLDGSYKFVSAGPDQRRTEVADATGHVRGSYTYLDEKGVQHSVHYIAGPETGYRVLKNVRGPHLPTVFPFGKPSGYVPPDFYDDFNGNEADVGDIFGGKNPSKPDGSGTPKPGGTRPSGGGGGGTPPPTVDGGDENYDDYDLFGAGGDKSKPSGSAKPGYPSSTTPIPGSIDGYGSTTPSYDISTTPSYGSGGSTPSGYDDGSARPFPSGNNYPGDTGRPEKPLTEYGPPGFGKPPGYGSQNRPRPGFGTQRPPSYGRPKPQRPPPSGGYDSNEVDGDGDDFGIFGNRESGVKPPRPFGGQKPSIQIGPNGRPCEKCQGIIVTNVGDKTFTVPPGVSVRAHVHSIDLIPYESKVPSPGARMRTDILADLKTAATATATEDDDDIFNVTKEAQTTSTFPTTSTSKKNE